MALPSHLRGFDDMKTTRSWMLDDTMSALKKRFPVEDDEYRLELNNPYVDGPTEFGLAAQKKALMRDDQLRIPIKGTWRLLHKPTGQVLDEREDTVMHMPYLTDRGTFIYRGNEYSTVSQSRLKPGVYTRKKKSGEIEAFYNVKPGTGRAFRVWLEPETGVFRVNVGQSNVPLYPLMRGLGVPDTDMAKAWGPEILHANASARAAQAMEKYYERFLREPPPAELGEEGRQAALRQAFEKAQVDPDVVARTLGVKTTGGISPAMLVRTTQKLLNVSRGDEHPDDRDAPMFSRVLGVEDFMRERIENDAGRIARTMLWKARRDKNLKRIKVGALNGYPMGYLLGSRMTQPLEETNPLALLEQMGRITKLGEGGISDSEAITDDARNVNIGQLGFIDPITGPEGTAIGIDTRAAYRTFKGRDGQMYGEFKTPAGKMEYLRPADLDGKVIAFPGELDRKGATVVAVMNGRVQSVPRDKVDYAVPSFAHMMSSNTNLNPMPTAVQAARQFYGAKFWSQYMPQVRGDVPLVDSMVDGSDETFSEHYGKRIGTLRSDVTGTVTKVTDDAIVIKDAKGKRQEIELVKDFPFNRLTGISYTAAVKPGDAVEPGTMLASSNFVDPKTGSLTMGRNLSVAVLPYRGKSYEDAYVISAAAAKKLATQRLYGFDVETRHDVSTGKNRYASLFPSKFTKDQLAKVDDDGLAMPGTELHYGDPVLLATGPKLLTPEDVQLGRLHKALRNAHTDKAIIWEHEYPGIVTDSTITRTGAKVNVKAEVPVQVGDKLSTRFGLKGVVGEIVDDEEMPRNASTNEPYDVMMNPMGILSRVAAGQLVEMQLGKLARRTGKQVRLPQLAPEEGWNRWALQQLADAGIPEKETVFSPTLGRNITKPIGTGDVYVMAFHHLSEKKLSDRGSSGAGYTMDELPAKGGEPGQQAKKMSSMDMTQLLAHGATDVIKDAQIIRGARNEEYWKALKLGRPLPEPGVPFVYNKMLALLKAGGINITEKGDTLKLMPMTDDDVGRLSKGEITSSQMVNDELEPIHGGLFDPGRTGGVVGKFWTHVTLANPMPNPVFEDPIRRLLGLRQKDFRGILEGTQELNGKTGGEAIGDALKNMDIDAEIAKQRANVDRYRGTNRDNAVKALGLLSAAKRNGVHPSQWMITKVPVLPPVFRPVSRLGDVTIQADLNELYRDLIEVNNGIRTLRKDLPETRLSREKGLLYDAVTAVYGLGDPITPEGKSKRLSGAIRTVIGDSPKTGFFQNRVLAKPVDTVGRAVVTPDPNLDMDSVGIPEDSAWGLYKDFVLRRLVRRGIPAERAMEMVEKRDPQAAASLQAEMQVRPIIMDRAPTWHKFNLMAFKPHIAKGTTVRVSPLITKGFTMDFDGDAVNFHVPVSQKAVDSALTRMLPSHNLFSLTDLKSVRHSPQQELALGLYMLTREQSNKAPIRFKSVADAKRAYAQGQIDANDPIQVDGI